MADIRHIHGGNLREAAEKYGLDGKEIIDFSANINPLGPPPKVLAAITENLSAITRYPDPESKELRRAVSEYTGIPPEMVVAGNGAVEIIYLLAKVLKPGKALIPAPTFNEYEIAVKTNGGKVKDLPLDEGKGFNVDKEKIFLQWDDTDLIFICNPNNPTGCLTSRGDLEHIIKEAREAGKTVVVDEAFLDFVPDRENYSVVDLVKKYNNLFVLYSLTKFFAIPGLRLGIGLGSREVCAMINQFRDPWNVNCFAQLAGMLAFTEDEYISATVSFVSREKDYLFNRIRSVKGFKPYYPSVNYIFVNVEETGYTAPEISHLLGKRGLLVRDCSSYKNLRPVFIRVAVRTRDENDRLIEAIEKLGGEIIG